MSKSRSLGVLVAVILALAGACSDTVNVPTTETAPAFTNTAPPILDDEPVTTQSTPVTDPPSNPDPWALTALVHRGRNGTRFSYQCPAGGPIYTVWGTETYTDDSSVCTAGVHAGLITVEEGGDVTIEIVPGQNSYTGSANHGVTTDDWEHWPGSFVFAD